MTIGDNLEEFYGKTVEDFDMAVGIAKPTGVVYRLRTEYDDEKSVPEMIAKFAADPNVGEVKALVIGIWDYEQGGSEEVVEALLEHKQQLSGLEAIMFGDITYEENEISWIEQSNLGPVINAFPNLVHFQCRGGNSLALKNVKHDKLKTLIIETGGMPSEVIRDVIKAELPNLEHLELWLGTEDYGFEAKIHDLRPILDGKKWPKLRHLGLRDSQIADAIAKALSVADQADVSSVQIEGKTFVLTGTLHQMKRSDAEKELEKRGAKTGGSVTKTTDYLVAGEKAGSKMEKAKSLGVPVLSEADLMKLLGGDTSNTSDVTGSILDQLKVLDLSMGTLGDEGAKALLENPKITNLDKLDLHYHYISDEMMEKLKGLPIQVDVSDQQDPDADPEDRYVAVAE
ncbi:MAG: BRCT domain-containing protein [bacterium]